MNKKNLAQVAVLLAALPKTFAGGYFPATNFNQAWDPYIWTSDQYLRPDYYEPGDPGSYRFSFGGYIEHGFNAEGRNFNNEIVDIYQIYGDTQNVAVFPSVDDQNRATALVGAAEAGRLNGTNIDNDNPVGGIRFKPNSSDRDETDLVLVGKMALPIESIPGQLELACHLPVKFLDAKVSHWDLRDINFTALPPTPADLAFLDTPALQSLFSNVANLDVVEYHEKYIGDLSCTMTWKNHYTQTHESLSNISVCLFSGLLLPTSKPRDIKNALAIPFGNDNAIGVPFGGMVNLNFMENIRLGAAVDFLVSFGEDSTRRMKTNASDGELFLRSEHVVRRDPGALVRITGLAEMTSFCKRYSGGLAYQFCRRSEDKFSSTDENFNRVVAEAAEKAQEFNYHQVMARFCLNLKEMSDQELAPVLSFCYKHALKGKRVTLYDTISFGATICF